MKSGNAKRKYRDREFQGTDEEREQILKKSTTVYVGNLSFYTDESQIYEYFSFAGPVKKVVMGLNKLDKTPCGFCFVEYFERCHTEAAIEFLNRTMLDARSIAVDIDSGFVEGRQYGRGKMGGQIRDEIISRYDQERGGHPSLKA